MSFQAELKGERERTRPAFILNLGNSDAVVRLKEIVRNMAREQHITIPEVVRQMIEYCVDDPKS